jgi:multiple sugar transport system permease protein
MPWVYVVLTGGLVVLVGPFVWMLLGSFRPDRELKQVPPAWLPQDPTLENYRTLFTALDFPTYLVNSAVVAGVVTVGNLVFCSMLGYALAKLHFPGRRIVFGLVIGTLMVPPVVVLVPLFVLVSNLGMVNSYPGLIFPFLAGPFGVFLMRQFIQSLPDELIHAAVSAMLGPLWRPERVTGGR